MKQNINGKSKKAKVKGVFKITFYFLLLTYSLSHPQTTTMFSENTETSNPDESWIMYIGSPVQDYKITLANVYNKLFGRTNEWTGINTFNGLTRFDSTVQQRGNQRIFNNFVTGWGGTGWQLDYGMSTPNQSSLILDNLTVRKRMSVYELLVRRIYAPNGNLLITSSMKVSENFNPNDSIYVVFEDPGGNGLSSFVKGDLIRAQKFSPTGNIIRITEAEVDTVYTNTFLGELFPVCQVTYHNGTAFEKGDDVVRIGNTIDTARQSLIYLASDDDYAPFIQLKSGINSWAAETDSNNTIVWIGKFDGYTDPDFGELKGAGLLATNVYLKGSMIFTDTNSVNALTNQISPKLKDNQTIYSTSAPTTRNDGSALKAYDFWIDSDDNSHLYIYFGGSWHDARDNTATWGLIDNIPNYIGAPSGSGLFIDGTHMGYYTSGAWKTYIDNTGKFYFYGDATHYIAWDGSALNIRGSLNADDINSGTITNITYNTKALSANENKISISNASISFINNLGGLVGSIAITNNDPSTITMQSEELAMNASRLTINSDFSIEVYGAGININDDAVATTSYVTGQGYITGITSSDVTTALGYTPVSTSGSYSNPSWISSLSTSKITGVVPIAKGGIGTDGTYLSNGKLLSYNSLEAIIESTPYSATDFALWDHTHSEYAQLAGSYSNPSWITALASSKITGAFGSGGTLLYVASSSGGPTSTQLKLYPVTFGGTTLYLLGQ